MRFFKPVDLKPRSLGVKSQYDSITPIDPRPSRLTDRTHPGRPRPDFLARFVS